MVIPSFSLLWLWTIFEFVYWRWTLSLIWKMSMTLLESVYRLNVANSGNDDKHNNSSQRWLNDYLMMILSNNFSNLKKFANSCIPIILTTIFRWLPNIQCNFDLLHFKCLDSSAKTNKILFNSSNAKTTMSIVHVWIESGVASESYHRGTTDDGRMTHIYIDLVQEPFFRAQIILKHRLQCVRSLCWTILDKL